MRPGNASAWPYITRRKLPQVCALVAGRLALAWLGCDREKGEQQVAQAPDWRRLYQYAAAGQPQQLDGYWLFAPVLEGDVQLYQFGAYLLGEKVLHFRTSVFTQDAIYDYDLLSQGENIKAKVVRRGDRFHLAAAPFLVIASDTPRKLYRVVTHDPAAGVTVEVEVQPRTHHTWPTGNVSYFGTQDSVVEGVISVGRKGYSFATRGSFEHASAALPTPPEQWQGLRPPFWQYEYVAWSDGQEQFGSLLWHFLSERGEKMTVSGFATSVPDQEDVSYDSYRIEYLGAEEWGGKTVPLRWRVTATRPEETFRYQAVVSRTTPILQRPAGWAINFLLDCQGEYHGPAGDRQLRGRGRAEYMVNAYNPATRRDA